MEKKNITQQAKEAFKEEIQSLVNQKLKEINHYIAGIDSPFNYGTIAETQGHLRDIRDLLDIPEEE